MPIATVEVVVDANETIAGDLAQKLADSIGRALESPPGQTWVRLRSIPREHYAENGPAPDAANLPVFVTVLKTLPSHGAKLRSEVAALTRAVAQQVARPVASVHIEYEPPALGRVAFGGNLVE
jgi:phenylpyruvate tautomerase PptA (4-oxalocrotonate tautomerase family)